MTMKEVLIAVGVVLFLGVTACARDRAVIIEYPPREPIERPRPGDRPTAYLPPEWVEYTIRGWVEQRPGERLIIPDHLVRVYRRGDGAIYVPPYEQEVTIEGRIERTPEGLREVPARKERRQLGGYWVCPKEVPVCKSDNPPPVELRERIPPVLPPPPAPRYP